MADAEITVTGIDEVLEKLRAIGPDLAETIRPAVAEALQIVRGRMREYPPPPPNSSYVRTGNLGASWEVIPYGSGDVLGIVRSAGPEYNRFVQSHEEQAGIHQGRWQTDEDVAREKEDEATAVLDELLNKLLQS